MDRRFAVMVAGFACLLGARVYAGATTPTLVVATGTVTAASGGRTATFEAAFDYENAVQADYDLELIVVQGRQFARYPVSGAPRVGESAALDDVLALGDLPALDAASTPAPAGVRVLSVGPSSMSVVFPATIGAGQASAALAATVDEGPLLSNPLVVMVP
jgi:hypothetical protein